METKCRKMLVLAYAVMSNAVALCGEAVTNGVMSASANQAPNANTSIEASIQTIAAGLAGDADVHDMRDAAAGLFSRIEAEEDVDVFRVHIEGMENAILGIRFREGPLADSYDDWARSINRFDEMCDRWSTAMWKRTRDWQWLWEFRLKQMEVYRKEMERIADAQPKSRPPNFSGVHDDLSSVRRLLRYRLSELIRLSFASSEQFADFYLDLPSNEQETWRNRIETASGMKFEFSQEGKQHIRDVTMRKPYDGGDALPHPFTFFGCTLGTVHEGYKRMGKGTSRDMIECWNETFKLEPPYFGNPFMFAKLAPRSRLAYSVMIIWSGVYSHDELISQAKRIKEDIEKRFGITLGDFFFELGSHVRDESEWMSAGIGVARSRSVSGPIRFDIDVEYRDGSKSNIVLTITDTAAEALVEKERKENPLKYDREAERRKFEKLKEMNRRRKVIPAKNTTK